MSNENISIGKAAVAAKKVIHFSDGSTMEVEDEVDDRKVKVVEEPEIHKIRSNRHPETRNEDVDPKKLSWPKWIKHYTQKGSNSVISGLDYTGESLAYYLGITTPKYQHEIDDYNKMVKKKANNDEEAKAWASTNPSTAPIVTEQKNTWKGEEQSNV